MLPNSKVILWHVLTISPYMDYINENSIVLRNKEEIGKYLENPRQTETLILDSAYNITDKHLLLALSWENWAKQLIVAASPIPETWADLFPQAEVFQLSYYYNTQVYYYTNSLQEQISNIEDEGQILVISSEPLKITNAVVTDDLTNLTNYNFKYVFDEMITELQKPTLTGGSRNELGYLSQDVYQARTKISQENSIIFRHISKKDFENLPVYFTSDIFNMPLHILMLELYYHEYHPFKILLPLGFSESDLRFVYHLLISQKTISINNKVMKSFQMNDLRNLGLRTSFIAEASPVLAACIDCYREGIFTFLTNYYGATYQYQIDNLKFIKEKYDIFRGLCDCQTLLNIYNASLEQELETWAEENALNYNYLQDLHNTVLSLTGDLQPVDIEEELNKAQPIIKEIYSDQRMDLNWRKTILTQYQISDTIYNISNTSINLIEQERPKELYALISYKVDEVNSIALCFAPL
jgi:hypothetical protein